MDTNKNETNKNETNTITNHNSCTTDSKVFGTVKQCKYMDDADSKICVANFCISCGENLGEHNPRQYCNKIYCPYEDEY
jgi:hypothetical protein